MLRTDAITENGLADYRYEIKFTVAERRSPEVESFVREHPAGFRNHYPPRRVNNIYFDTYAWSNLEANLAGSGNRAKLRLRWYGQESSRITGILELKHKHAGLGRKLSCSTPEPIHLAGQRWFAILKRLRSFALGPLAPFLDILCCPTIINRYRRQYMISADGLVRLTIDTSVTAFDQTLYSCPNLTRRIFRAPVAILELKAPASQHERVLQVAEAFPLRPSAYSKYVEGLAQRREYSY